MGPSLEVQGTLPQCCPPSIHVIFNKDFLYLPPQIKAGEGHRVGNRTQDPRLQGDCPPRTFKVNDTFCPRRVRDSCLHPRTQGKHRPGSEQQSLGHGPRQGSTQTVLWTCSRPPWCPGASSFLSHSPCYLYGAACLGSFGIFFWGIILLHDPPQRAGHACSAS